MKKIFLTLCLVTIILCAALPISAIPAMAAETDKGYRAYYVMDFDTGTVIAEENANDKYPIASMVKIMTLAITFDEISKGNLNFDETITVSDYAAGMGGSQMFLDAGAEYPINDLIKGVIVCSANDAATALGERISGNIEAFVVKMNAYAKEIGMNDTVFCNATGLPNSGEQYSTAHDVSLMMQKVMSCPEYYKYSKIWMENYTHPDGRITEMVNTNKLIRIMPECDGGKTGFTNEAGFCLSAGAKQGETKVIATLLGGSDSKTRFRKVSELLKSALAKYETKVYVRKNEKMECSIPQLKKAKTTTLNIYCDKDLKFFTEKNSSDSCSTEINFYENLVAPIAANSPIGTLNLLNPNGEIISSATLYTDTEIEKMTFGDYLKKIIQNNYFKH